MTRQRRGVHAVLATVLLAGLGWATTGPTPSAAQAPRGEFAEAAEAVPGQYIVTLRPVPGAEVTPTAESLAAEHDGRILFTYRDALQGFAAEMSEADALALSQEPDVARVEENGVVHTTATQASPPWGLDRIDQGDLTRNGTYEYGNDGAGVRAYVLDTGIRRTHVQFGSRVAKGFTAIRDGRGTRDCEGHGTHVAGTIGGSTYGVAKRVRLVPVRVLNCQNSGTTARVIAGVDWVTANAVRPAVANMSLGAFNSPSLEAAVARSISRGIVYVVSAGNDDIDACTRVPARVPEALTVGAVDDTDTRASFSNSGSCVDLLAPGVDIVSAGHLSNTARATLSGTSMATPHVAGVVARFLQQHPTASPATVSTAVLDNTLVDRVGDPAGANRLLYSRFLDGVAPPTTPANDAYAAATPITGTTGSLVGSNRTATSEGGESLFDTGDAGATVWYRWTATTTGPSPLFDVCDGSFDAVLSAYTGSTLAGRTSLTTTGVFCNVGTRKSGLSFPAVAGQDYHLAVDGTTASPTGWFQLRWMPS